MRSKMLCKSALDAIGRTPLVKLSNILPHLDLPPSVAIFAKLDNLSLGGSKKDRIAKQIVLDALDNGTLSPGQSIVELTSGNTSILPQSIPLPIIFQLPFPSSNLLVAQG